MPTSCWRHASRRLSAVLSRLSGGSCRYRSPPPTPTRSGIPKRTSLQPACPPCSPRPFPLRTAGAQAFPESASLLLRGGSFSTSMPSS